MSGIAANHPTADKSSKRKKNKGSDSVSEIVVPRPASAGNGAETAVNGGDSEHPYVKELHKSVRNLRKKLANTEKVQSILNENKGKTLDDLLEERKINVDQKKQIENKPAVEAQIKITEEQLEQFKKFEEDCEKRAVKKAAADQLSLKKIHDEALKAKDQELDKSRTGLENTFKIRLLTLSRFLRTAAAKRQAEEKLPENDAFEGVLLQLYGGDTTAVEAMQNLINGSESIVSTVEGEPSAYTFKQVRDVVIQQSEEMEAAEPPAAEQVVESDPTVVNAGLTEIEGSVPKSEEANEVKVVPESATVDTGAANAAAAAAATSPQDLSTSVTSDAWVEVRNPNETDTGLNATPAAITNQESWAEDVPTDAAVPQATNDGFSEVKHNRGGRGRGGRGGRSRGEGFRGRGRGGGFRGDGDYRGRGRGRGGYRGGRGGGAQAGGDTIPAQS